MCCIVTIVDVIVGVARTLYIASVVMRAPEGRRAAASADSFTIHCSHTHAYLTVARRPSADSHVGWFSYCSRSSAGVWRQSGGASSGVGCPEPRLLLDRLPDARDDSRDLNSLLSPEPERRSLLMMLAGMKAERYVGRPSELSGVRRLTSTKSSWANPAARYVGAIDIGWAPLAAPLLAALPLANEWSHPLRSASRTPARRLGSMASRMSMNAIASAERGDGIP